MRERRHAGTSLAACSYSSWRRHQAIGNGNASSSRPLGARGALKATLSSTNPCESMIECVRRSSRNVKRWQSGEMCLRWTAAGMLEAERQFRRVIGYRDLAKLAVAIEREVAATPTAHHAKEAVTV